MFSHLQRPSLAHPRFANFVDKAKQFDRCYHWTLVRILYLGLTEEIFTCESLAKSARALRLPGGDAGANERSEVAGLSSRCLLSALGSSFASPSAKPHIKPPAPIFKRGSGNQKDVCLKCQGMCRRTGRRPSQGCPLQRRHSCLAQCEQVDSPTGRAVVERPHDAELDPHVGVFRSTHPRVVW